VGRAGSVRLRCRIADGREGLLRVDYGSSLSHARLPDSRRSRTSAIGQKQWDGLLLTRYGIDVPGWKRHPPVDEEEESA